MFSVVKDFFKDGFEEIKEVFIKPFLCLSFYKKCFLIILAGLVLYLPYMNTVNASHDERYTILLCHFDILEMIKTIIAEDGHPPLSYLYAKLWIELFGGDVHQVLALRCATLFMFFLTALLGVFPLKRLLGEKVSLAFICFVFVLPSSFDLAMNMRMYPLAVFFMGGEFIYAMLAVYKPQKGDFLKFALFSLLALYTHYYCVILSIVIWGIVFIDLLRLKKYHNLISFFIGGFCVALLFVPWFFAFLSQYQNITDLWYPQVGDAFMAIDGALFSYHYVSREYYKILCFFGILCWLFVFEFLFDVKKEKLEYIVIKRATIVFWSIYLIALALSLFLRPNLVERYLVIPVAIFYMGIAVSFVHFKKFRLIFLSLFVIVFIMGYNGTHLKVQDKTYQQMQTYLREDLPQNSLILYDHTTSHLALMFYAPEKNICKALRKKYLELFKEKVKQEEKNLENLKKYDKIYYMLSLWDWTEYNNCQEQWRSKYDNTAYCLKEISADTAKSIISHSKN